MNEDYYPASRLHQLLGDHPTALRGDRWPALGRNYRRIKNGSQGWVSSSFAERLLETCSHHDLWELGEPCSFPRGHFPPPEGVTSGD